jgi:hypothetical protein
MRSPGEMIEREENLQRFDAEAKDSNGPYCRLQRFRGAEVLNTDCPRMKSALLSTSLIEQWAVEKGSPAYRVNCN